MNIGCAGRDKRNLGKAVTLIRFTQSTRDNGKMDQRLKSLLTFLIIGRESDIDAVIKTLLMIEFVARACTKQFQNIENEGREPAVS